jgi:hypothetical protein
MHPIVFHHKLVFNTVIAIVDLIASSAKQNVMDFTGMHLHKIHINSHCIPQLIFQNPFCSWEEYAIAETAKPNV